MLDLLVYKGSLLSGSLPSSQFTAADVPQLLALLSDPDHRVNAMLALTSLGPDGDDGVIRALGNSDDGVRLWATRLVKKMQYPQAIPQLVTRVLADSIPEIRYLAMTAILQLGSVAVATLLHVTSDRESRGVVIDGLLEVYLNSDADRDERSAAQQAMVEVGPAAIPRLVKCAAKAAQRRDEYAFICTGALILTFGQSAVRPLSRVLKSKYKRIRACAEQFMRQIRR